MSGAASDVEADQVEEVRVNDATTERRISPDVTSLVVFFTWKDSNAAETAAEVSESIGWPLKRISWTYTFTIERCPAEDTSRPKEQEVAFSSTDTEQSSIANEPSSVLENRHECVPIDEGRRKSRSWK
jgi:hypothetical protein